MILYFSFPSLWIVFGDTYRCSSLCPFSNNYYLKSFWKVKMNAKLKFFISFTFWTTIQHNSPCICRNSCKWSTPNPLSNLVTFCRNVKNVKLPSCVRLFATPLTVACLPGSSVHGIFQARILEWVAISFSRRIFSTQGLKRFSHTAGRLYRLSHRGNPGVKDNNE